jgi:hypothetical protein
VRYGPDLVPLRFYYLAQIDIVSTARVAQSAPGWGDAVEKPADMVGAALH